MLLICIIQKAKTVCRLKGGARGGPGATPPPPSDALHRGKYFDLDLDSCIESCTPILLVGSDTGRDDSDASYMMQVFIK